MTPPTSFADPVTIPDQDSAAVKDTAHIILAFIEGSPVGYLAAIHAATIVMTSMAIEQPDSPAALEELLEDIRAEGRAMIEVVASGMAHDA